MMNMLGLETLKEIPGYSAIIKAVLKSLIQGLLEQLSEQTGEESVILTASLSDGTLCHLGSLAGKDFLEGREEIKSQFLRHCLKKHHSTPISTSETQARHRETYDGAHGYSFSPESSSKRPSHTESSSTDWAGNKTVPQKRRRGMEYNSLDGASMEHSWSQSSFEKYQNRNQSENDDSAFAIHTTSQESSELNVRTGEQSNQSLRRSHSQLVESQTGSSDQMKSEDILPETETGSEAIVKQELDDSDVTITGMEPGRNNVEYTESWSPGLGDLQGYNAATQGVSSYTGDAPQVSINDAENRSKGNNSGMEDSQDYSDMYQDSHSTETGHSYNISSQGIQNSTNRHNKKFACGFCGKTFVRNFDRKRHQAIHTGERFDCSYCPKSFSQKYHRDIHVKYQCDNRPAPVKLNSFNT